MAKISKLTILSYTIQSPQHYSKGSRAHIPKKPNDFEGYLNPWLMTPKTKVIENHLKLEMYTYCILHIVDLSLYSLI